MFQRSAKNPDFSSLLRLMVAALFLVPLIAACSPANDNGEGAGVPAHIQAALDNAARGDAAKARDEGRKPGEILALYGLEPGMTVLEVGAGGGYYTQILSGAVGPDGKVIAQNTPSEYYLANLKDTFEALAQSLPNVEMQVGALGDIELAPNSLDMALITLIYHHMHYVEAEGENLPEATKQNLRKIFAALKPGGVLGIIEHAAPDGTSRADSNTIHRVDEATTTADITARGFRLEAASDLLHVDSDDRTIYWYNTPHQGKTWRLAHKYTKP